MSRGNGGGGGVIGAYIVGPIIEYVRGVGFLTAVVLLVAGGGAAAYVCSNIVIATFETIGIMVKQIPAAGTAFQTGQGLGGEAKSILVQKPKADNTPKAKN